MDWSASYSEPILPCASGIIDDLIVKAKVFGASAGQFLLTFLKILASLSVAGAAARLLLKNLLMRLHLSGAAIVKTRNCGAIIFKSFNVINTLRKSIVKSVAIFYCCDVVRVLSGFLFVFPESNLYNAARLAGRVSFKVIYK